MPRRHAVPAAALAILAGLMPSGALGQEPASRAQVQALTRAYNKSGHALFRDFAARPGNIVFSPYSIGTAMAMALAGARGDTAHQMAQVLQQTLPAAQINDANAAAMAILNGYDRSASPPTCPAGLTLAGERCEGAPRAGGGCALPARMQDGVCVAAPTRPASAKLLVANALMLSAAAVNADYEALLRRRYAAEVFRGASLDTVNNWVSQRTEGKIDRILERMSDLVLVNAVYFKSRWALVFDQKLTKDEFFNLTRSRQELVPTMLQRADHIVVSRQGYRAIRLPYAVRSLAMVIALPDDIEGVGAVAQRIDEAELAETLTALRSTAPRPVVLTLPRFKVSYSANLKEAFQALGMTLPFAMGRADFSGMVKNPAAIDQIVHRAVIEVAEEATEAAAATAIGIRVTSAPPKPVEPLQFRVDRPFLYYLVDDTTGAVLFQGRVVDPR
ncbi:MAG: hypothetical protein IT536_10150 [Hyphomicrobiales bacterium]|nr:hypothetical protein [Hyphomicrobiales bacterium]